MPSVRPIVLAGAALVLATGAGAQGVTDRPPLLSGDWVGLTGIVYFNFIHRFSETGGPEHKVLNTPTFLLGTAMPWNTFIGVNYATNSELVSRYPNEHEYFLRALPVAQDRGAPLDVGFQAGYNDAAQGADGEATLARQIGSVRLLAEGRVLKGLADTLGTRVGFGGGAVVHLSKYIALAGDAVGLTRRLPTEKIAWSAGLQFKIPETPHTLSLQVTNVSSNTLQGSARGTGQTREGFEFTIPITLKRYFGRRAPEAPQPVAAAPRPTGPVKQMRIAGFDFRPTKIEVGVGTTVVWNNDDEVGHTVTADDGSFSSRLIEPGHSFEHTFDRPGEYHYHCGPHPFMLGVVIVR